MVIRYTTLCKLGRARVGELTLKKDVSVALIMVQLKELLLTQNFVFSFSFRIYLKLRNHNFSPVKTPIHLSIYMYNIYCIEIDAYIHITSTYTKRPHKIDVCMISIFYESALTSVVYY